LFPKKIKQRFLDLLQQILVFNPMERLTAKQILENPIFDCIRVSQNEQDAPYKVKFELDNEGVFDYENLRCSQFSPEYYK
jgi:serine/threonine protein kinase